MSEFNYHIERPGVAIALVFLIGALLGEYGVMKGGMMLFALLAGVVIYKLVTAQ